MVGAVAGTTVAVVVGTMTVVAEGEGEEEEAGTTEVDHVATTTVVGAAEGGIELDIHPFKSKPRLILSRQCALNPLGAPIGVTFAPASSARHCSRLTGRSAIFFSLGLLQRPKPPYTPSCEVLTRATQGRRLTLTLRLTLEAERVLVARGTDTEGENSCLSETPYTGHTC